MATLIWIMASTELRHCLSLNGQGATTLHRHHAQSSALRRRCPRATRAV